MPSPGIPGESDPRSRSSLPSGHRRACGRVSYHPLIWDGEAGRLDERFGDSRKSLGPIHDRSEEHTSELQSPCNLVCRLLLEKKKHKLNVSHLVISYAVFCLKKKNKACCKIRLYGKARPSTGQTESPPISRRLRVYGRAKEKT